jgi:hypothetical protein
MWTPREVRKLIAQISGIIFGIGGILLMIADVKTTGKINITSNLVSGQIESGSAGLLLLFFSFFLILIPAISGKNIQSTEKNKKVNKNNQVNKGLTMLHKAIISAIVCGTLSIICFLSSHTEALKTHTSFTNFLLIGGYGLGAMTGLLIIGSVFEFFEPSEEKQNNQDAN